MFNPFSGQFEANRSTAVLEPSIYEELKGSAVDAKEEALYVKEHVLKDKQHLREIKARLRALEASKDIPQPVTAPYDDTELKGQITKLDYACALLVDQISALEEKLQKVEQLAKSAPKEITKTRELVVKEVSAPAKEDSRITELLAEVETLKKQMKVSYGLTAVGVIIYFAKLLLA
jgi:predicted  nucleic acid-binding Zn-ribbon protein